MKNNNQTVMERAMRFLDEMGTPSTKFCERVQIAGSTFYAWRSGKLRLSDDTLARIDDYLRKYNF